VFDQRKTFCPYCGVPIILTLTSDQVTARHLDPLCVQAIGAIHGLRRVVEKLPATEEELGN
jgi:hypothetical protein